MKPCPPSEADCPRNEPATPIAGDMLYGADAIAQFLFGERKHRRMVYNLVDGNSLLVFRIGANICARKSILLEWIAEQERGNMIHREEEVVGG